MEIDGGGEVGEPFLISEDIFSDFTKDIDSSTECKNNVSDGKTKRKRRTNKNNKNNKNKTKRTYKHKQKNINIENINKLNYTKIKQRYIY